MPAGAPRDYGTLVIAALLILALAFSGCWIFAYVEPGQKNPWWLLPWFGVAAVVILVVGLVRYLSRTRSSGGA